MPTYEYRCPEGHAFEKFQRMSDPAEGECPECGQAAERIMSGGAGLLFKGEGFYITDYRSDSYKKAAQKEKGSTEGSSKSESKSESKSTSDSGTGSGGSSGAASSGAAGGTSSKPDGKKGSKE